MTATNGMVKRLVDRNSYKDQNRARAAHSYSDNLKNLTDYNRSNEEQTSSKGDNFSVSIAAGLKLKYNDKNGFSLSVLTPEDIVKEHQRVNKTVKIAPTVKGGSINIYC